MFIHLNIGSNKGNRTVVIGKAIALIAKAFAPARITLSDYFESEPWGYDSPNAYLNRGVSVRTTRLLHPEQVLELTQSIEHTLAPDSPHRNPDNTFCDRVLDIDIILIDHLTYRSDTLILPHPHYEERPFVLLPLRSLEKGA